MTVCIDIPSPTELHPLIERWPQLPYPFCPELSTAARLTYLEHSVLTGASKSAATYTASDGGELRALARLEELPWDSDLLGFPVARLNNILYLRSDSGAAALGELLCTAVDAARGRGIRYLMARIPASEILAAQQLEQCGFQLVDGLLTLGAQPPGTLPWTPADELYCAAAREEDLEQLQQIAANSFFMDRFHSDPVISNATADDVHRRWITDSLRASPDQVLAARKSSGVVGFTTLKLDPLSESALGLKIGTIVLVATDPAHRRAGAARMLTQHALQWFGQRGCAWVEVGTQFGNVNASRVYLAAGMRPVASSLTFRLLLSPGM